MTGRLIVFAQASTAAARHGVFADEAIDQKGREAAVAAREKVPRHEAVVTSPALASRETAACLGLEAAVDDELGDLDVGAWRGQSLTDIATRDEAGAAAFLSDPTFRGHGGESIADLTARAGRWLDARRAMHGVSIAVMPAALVRAMAVAALDGTARSFWRIDVAPLSALTLGTDGRRWTLRALEPA